MKLLTHFEVGTDISVKKVDIQMLLQANNIECIRIKTKMIVLLYYIFTGMQKDS